MADNKNASGAATGAPTVSATQTTAANSASGVSSAAAAGASKPNYATAARQPVPSRPAANPAALLGAGGAAPGVGAAATGAPPPRTSSAPPEQQNMLHSVKPPNFIPDKSTGSGARGPAGAWRGGAPSFAQPQQSGGAQQQQQQQQPIAAQQAAAAAAPAVAANPVAVAAAAGAAAPVAQQAQPIGQPQPAAGAATQAPLQVGAPRAGPNAGAVPAVAGGQGGAGATQLVFVPRGVVPFTPQAPGQFVAPPYAAAPYQYQPYGMYKQTYPMMPMQGVPVQGGEGLVVLPPGAVAPTAVAPIVPGVAPQAAAAGAGAQTPPSKPAPKGLQFIDPSTGKPKEIVKAPLKMTTAVFEPKSGGAGAASLSATTNTAPATTAPTATSTPAAGAPATTGDAAATATVATPSTTAPVSTPQESAVEVKSKGEIARPGRWIPPPDDSPVKQPPAQTSAATATTTTPHAVIPPYADVTSIQAREADKAHEKPAAVDHPVAPAATKASETAPAAVEPEPEVAPVIVHQPPAVVATETQQPADSGSNNVAVASFQPTALLLAGGGDADWESVNAADLGREVDERVAANHNVSSEAPPTIVVEKKKDEPIRYDDISYNPLSDDNKGKKKKYTKEFLLQFREKHTEKPQDLEASQLEIVESAGSGGSDLRPRDRDHSREHQNDRSPGRQGGGGGNRRDDRKGQFRDRDWENKQQYNRNASGEHQGGGGGGGRRGKFKHREPPKPVGPPVEPLTRSESGWKPEKEDLNTEDGMRSHLLKEAQGHLNKMTALTYEKLSNKLVNIAVRENGTPPLPGLLRELINRVFEQALCQPTFCPMYAALCTKISRQTNDFRRVLLNKCQEEFESDSRDPPAEVSDVEKEMLRYKAKQRMLGNIKFICELFKQTMLSEEIMHSCVMRLLRQDMQDPDEEQTEALCDLLSAIGKILDKGPGQKRMDGYFKQLDIMRTGPNVGARLRFMVEDLCDMRNGGWRPGKGNPKAVLRAAKGGKGEKEGGGEKGGKDSPSKGGSGAGTPETSSRKGDKGGDKSGGDGWKEVTKKAGAKGPATPTKGGKQQGQGGQAGGSSKQQDQGGKKGGAAGGKDGGKGGPGGQRGRGADTGAGAAGKRTSGSANNSNHNVGSSAPVPISGARRGRDADDDDEDSFPVKASGAAAAAGDSDANQDFEQYKSAALGAIDEYWEQNDPESVTYALEKDFPEEYRSQFVCEAIKHALTGSEKQREKLADLLFSPEVEELLTKTNLREGFGLVIADLAELSMDHPQAPRKVGVLIARAVNESLYVFRELWSLFDAHTDAGFGFGVGAEVLGAVLQSLCKTSSAEQLHELVVANHFTNIASKLRTEARNEAEVTKFLNTFGLKDVFPGAAAASAGGAPSSSGGAAGIVAASSGVAHTASLSVSPATAGQSPLVGPDGRPRALSKGSPVPAREFRPAEEALAQDKLAMAVYTAMKKDMGVSEIRNILAERVSGDLQGNHVAAKQTLRAIMEHLLTSMPFVRSEKVIDPENLKKEAKFVKLRVVPLMKLFVRTQDSELGSTVLDCYIDIMTFHPELHSAFGLRALQYWLAYGFVTKDLLQQYANSGTGVMHKNCARMLTGDLLPRKDSLVASSPPAK